MEFVNGKDDIPNIWNEKNKSVMFETTNADEISDYINVIIG